MNKNINKILLTLVVSFGALGLTSALANADVTPQQPFAYSATKQLELTQLDSLKRAVDAHIQLQESDEPTDKREPTISYDPTGWHNYQLPTASGATTKAWLFNRGHLVGYQFSGLNSEPKNLTIETAYLNQGSINGPDAGNQAAMLFYENKLDAWLAKNPTWHLDYQVTPIYTGDELVPRKVRLAYVGYDDQGAVQPIKFETALEKTGNGQATVVTLNNVSANAKINYATGTATASDTGWHTTSTGTYYIKNDGTRAKGFYTVGSTLYYFNSNGWQYKNRWFKVGNTNYHVNASGVVAKGFVKVNGNNYYFDVNGKQYKNRWFKIGTTNYHVDSHGYVAKGFVKVNGNNYYFDGNGKQYKNRWFSTGGATYRVDSHGYVVRGFQTINKHKYFFLTSNGKQVKDKKNYVISGKKYNISKQGYVTAVPAVSHAYTTSGKWTTAASGQVFVSKSGLYYSKVTNPGNYKYMSEAEAKSHGYQHSQHGNASAQP